MSKFDWRQLGQDQPDTQYAAEDGRAGYKLTKIWVPDDVPNLLVGADHWQPVRDIRFGSDEKAFLHGFTSLLNLTPQQEWQLLDEYAKRYRKALDRAGQQQRRLAIANEAANAWIRNGAIGYLIRE